MSTQRIYGLACIAAASCLLLNSCASKTRGPYSAQASDLRDIRKAEEIYQQAVAAIADSPETAKALLREALGFDLYHGAAHNNLGVLLLGENKLYDAAEEFEWARKLMPGHPEPRVNLAITLERGGKHTDAMDAAKTALEVQPGHLGAIKTLAYIQIREGVEDKTTKGYLDTIVARSDDTIWTDWATRQSLRLESKLLTQ
ncbi:MAG: tetratricopeptide repeat protein [Planctomycetota bacterium]